VDFQRAVAEASLSAVTLSVALGLYVVPTAAELYTGAGPYKFNDRLEDFSAEPYTDSTLSVSHAVADRMEDAYLPVKENGWCLSGGNGEVSRVEESEWVNRDRDYVAFECGSDIDIRAHTHPVTATISKGDRDGVEKERVSCIYSGGELSGRNPVNLNCYTRVETDEIKRVNVEVGGR